jgi:hypothetical protein
MTFLSFNRPLVYDGGLRVENGERARISLYGARRSEGSVENGGLRCSQDGNGRQGRMMLVFVRPCNHEEPSWMLPNLHYWNERRDNSLRQEE